VLRCCGISTPPGAHIDALATENAKINGLALIPLAKKGIVGNIVLLTGAPGGIIGKCGKVLI